MVLEAWILSQVLTMNTQHPCPIRKNHETLNSRRIDGKAPNEKTSTPSYLPHQEIITDPISPIHTIAFLQDH
jgi:hypothetical protein